MTDQFQDLYQNLLNEIDKIEKDSSEPKKIVETCFHRCETARRQVERLAAQDNFFSNDAEEISFFKETKPKFTSLVEFYSILYRAELFVPDTRADQIEFWNHELERAQQFLIRNASLHNFLKTDSTAADDKKYFLRADGQDAAPYDDIIAKLMARERYVAYINDTILPAINP